VLILAISGAVLLLYMTALFAVAMRLANNGVADVGYGIAFIVVIVATALQLVFLSIVQLLVVMLPIIWGLRLAWRIGRKNMNKPEDFRYAAWRTAWGNTVYIRSFLQIYMLQGVIVFLIALPVLLMLVFPQGHHLNALTLVGVALWIVGFLFQTIGDYQLDRFVADPSRKGQIMMSGLWAYSRHPNYFGESVMWWGIAIAVIPLTMLPVVGFISPILITFLLLKVSGVPMLEKRWENHPAWAEYKRKTSVFIPMMPAR
jgi:steroid 5-alpha reductase family enzyme